MKLVSSLKEQPIWIFRIVCLALILLNLAFITFFSSQNAQKSQQTSQTVTENIVDKIDPGVSTMDPNKKQDYVAKKTESLRDLAHVLEFTSLGFLLLLFLQTFSSIGSIPFPIYVATLVSLFIGSVYGFLDELYQFLFSEGRAMQMSDVGKDSLGVCIGTFLALALVLAVRLFRKIGKKKSAIGE